MCSLLLIVIAIFYLAPNCEQILLPKLQIDPNIWWWHLPFASSNKTVWSNVLLWMNEESTSRKSKVTFLLNAYRTCLPKLIVLLRHHRERFSWRDVGIMFEGSQNRMFHQFPTFAVIPSHFRDRGNGFPGRKNLGIERRMKWLVRYTTVFMCLPAWSS